MTSHALAQRLKEFGIVSKSNGHVRGYHRDRFDDAWVRYDVVPECPHKRQTVKHPSKSGGSD